MSASLARTPLWKRIKRKLRQRYRFLTQKQLKTVEKDLELWPHQLVRMTNDSALTIARLVEEVMMERPRITRSRVR